MWDIVITLIIAVLAYGTKALNLRGTLIAVVIAYGIMLMQGFNWLAVLMVFFIVSMLATRHKHSYKKIVGMGEERRGTNNVIGNGLVPFVMALSGNLYGFLGSVATATADTLSSEMGVISKEKPISIVTFEEVEIGTNGGISNTGNLFLFIGAVSIAFIGIFLFSSDAVNTVRLFWITLWSGVFGCFVDSFLGALLENDGYLNNMQVNLLATGSGAFLAMVLSLI